jgi:hypothetical protein
MKNKLKILLSGSIISLLIFSISSCNKINDFGNLNIDPNTIPEPIPSALLTNVESGIGAYLWDGGRFSTNPGLYSQYFTETQYTEEARYATPTFEWSGIYAGPLEDLQNIINYNSNPATKDKAASYGSNANQIAVATILKTYYFWTLTDMWGDIPYSGALKGVGEVQYDNQSAMYTDFFNQLKNAVGMFDAGAMPSGDIIFNGNQAQWKKFANSIRLLMALRLSQVDPATGKSEFNSALNAGVIEDNADNATIVYPGGNFPNPIYNYYNIIQRKDYAVTDVFVNALKNMNDPRLAVLASSDVGFPYGLERPDAIAFNNANPNWARVLSSDYRQETSPMFIITSSEVWLARAEAALNGWTSEDVVTDYTTGISQSWKQWDVYDAGSFATYIAQPDVVLAGTPQQMLEKIATQEWFAYFPDGKQGWALWRRTGYPVLTPAPGTSTIPRRFPYPPTEDGLNGTNKDAAAAQYQLNGENDSQFAKVWWDKN